MSHEPNKTTINQSWTTESGFDFGSIDLAWHSWGTLNDARDNVILIFHALTGNSDAQDWFAGLFAEDGIIDLNQHFVICINNLGSCYGSSGPTSVDPETGNTFQASFPEITIRDIVKSQQMLLDYLNIHSIELAIGGSMGGMIGLEFALMDSRIKSLALIAMGASHSPWAIGISHAQRNAIKADKNWNDGFYDVNNPPALGLESARSLAMITYRSAKNYELKFGRDYNIPKNKFEVESYLDYQGEKLSDRFDANSYITLTKAMDSHDIGRDRNSVASALSQIDIPVLVIGINSDLLYPVHEQKQLADSIQNAVYKEIDSIYGHDAFLIEFDQINTHLNNFITSIQQPDEYRIKQKD